MSPPWLAVYLLPIFIYSKNNLCFLRFKGKMGHFSKRFLYKKACLGGKTGWSNLF